MKALRKEIVFAVFQKRLRIFQKTADLFGAYPTHVEIAARKAGSEMRALPSDSCIPKSSFCDGMFLRRLSLNFSAHTL